MTSPDDEVDHPLTTKEGWARFVSEILDALTMLSPAAFQKLTDSQRGQYDTLREHYHPRLVIVFTPTIRHVAAAELVARLDRDRGVIRGRTGPARAALGCRSSWPGSLPTAARN